MLGVAVLVVSVLLGNITDAPLQTRKPPAKPAAPVAQAAPAKVTNADIIEMVSAGLSEPIIMSAIRSAPAKSFDLTPMGLVSLKKAGVSDALIQSMQNGGAVPPEVKPAAPAAEAKPGESVKPSGPLSSVVGAGTAPGAVLAEDGVYYVDGANLRRVEAKAPYQTRTGSTAVSRLTLGIKRAKLNAMLPGLSAEVPVSQSPQFYVHLAESESVGDYYLLKFTVNQGQGRRELEVGSAGLGKAQAGFAEKDIFLVEARRLEKNVYLITSKTGLSAGEYALLVVPQATGSAQTGLTPRKIFDFSVR